MGASGEIDLRTPAEFERHGVGFARLNAEGRVLGKSGSSVDWLPAAGGSCFETPLLFGLEDEFRALRAGAAPLLSLPGVGLGQDADKLGVTVVWNETDSTYTLVATRAFGASETEHMLVRERRERRLADEQAEAARRRANISEALYRDIVESDADFVLRLTPDLRIAFANTRLVAFAGGSLADLIGRAVADALPAGGGASWTQIPARADSSFEQQLTGGDGEPVWIWWRVAWLQEAGEHQAIGRDVTLLRKLRAEVERANAEARQALVMRERLKIAHDLHDTIVHALVAVVAQLRLIRKLETRAPERVPDELRAAEEAARAGLERGREALGQVRFQRAGVEGLPSALRRLAERFGERTGLEVDLDLDASANEVSGERAEILYRIAEEALRNVERHSGAASVRLCARASGGEAQIEIADDGRGFDAAGAFPGHYGLQGMREQAEMLGGRLEIDARPGFGVRTIVRAPISAQE